MSKFRTRLLGWKAVALTAVGLLVAGIAITSCDQPNTSTSTASCAYVTGNGQNGNDSNIHQIIYPGQQVHYDTDNENVSFIPCNSRNYIINNGTQDNANGQKIGDRFTPSLAYTDTGVPIEISSSTYWTLNENQPALDDFYNLCFKYTCSSSQDQSGSSDFSTPGWNGMLGENFSPTLNTLALDAAAQVGDAIWQKHSPALYQQLGDLMSSDFDTQIEATTGYNLNLFCGSGDSYWKTPSDRKNGWVCSPVRILVNDVEQAPTNSTNSTSGQQELDKQRVAAAQILYGSEAYFWLGVQDTVADCPKGSTCVINIGSQSSVSSQSGTSTS